LQKFALPKPSRAVAPAHPKLEFRRIPAALTAVTREKFPPLLPRALARITMRFPDF
jgi:hypothetical protein